MSTRKHVASDPQLDSSRRTPRTHGSFNTTLSQEDNAPPEATLDLRQNVVSLPRTPEHMMALQRTLGNRATSRLITHTGASQQTAQASGVIQRKPALTSHQQPSTIIQRKGETKDEEKKKRGIFGSAFDATKKVGKAVGGAVLGAGKAVGGAVFGAGKAVGGAVLGAGKAIGDFAVDAGNTIGGAVVGAGKVVGGAISDAADWTKEKAIGAGKYIGEKAASAKEKVGKLNQQIEDDRQPVEQQSAFVNTAAVHKYAGQILHAMEGHQHASQKDYAFLQQDQFVLQNKSTEFDEKLKKTQESLSSVKDGLKEKAGEQTDAINKKIEEYTKDKDANDAQLALTNDRVDRTARAMDVINADNQSVKTTYLGIKGIHEDVEAGVLSIDEMMPLVTGNVGKIAEVERDTIQKRNAIAKDANEVRKTGRSATLVGGLAKTVLAQGLSAGLSIATAGYLKVENKARGGDYSSTLRISTGKERWLAELARLQAIANSTLYGNKAASTVYATIKGFSTLVVVPIRDLIGWLTLVVGLIGTVLTAASLGGAAPVVVAAQIMGYITIGLTALNALINGVLFTWNIVRELLLQNEAKRAMLRGETVNTGITTVTEAATAAVSGAAAGFNTTGFAQSKTLGSKVASGAVTAGKTGAKIGFGIGAAVVEKKAGFAQMAKMEKEKVQTPSILAGPHKSRGTKIGRAANATKKALGDALTKTAPAQDKLVQIVGYGASLLGKFTTLKQSLLNAKSKKAADIKPAELKDHVDTTEAGQDVSTLISQLFGQTDEALESGKLDLVKQVEEDEKAELVA